MQMFTSAAAGALVSGDVVESGKVEAASARSAVVASLHKRRRRNTQETRDSS